MDVGTLYTIYQSDQGSVQINPEHEQDVNRAMQLWVREKRDTWLSLFTSDGAEFCVLASSINSTMKSNPQQRSDSTLREKAIADERAANRRDAGFVEAEP